MGRQQILPRGLQNLAPRDLQVSRDIFGRGKTLQSRCFWLQAHALPFMWLKLGLYRPIKKHSFHNWRGKERKGGAVNLRSGAEPEGAEAITARFWVYAPRRAAQAGLTGGAERS